MEVGQDIKLLYHRGTPVYCLAGNIYGVRPDHIKILRRKRIPFKRLNARAVHLPKSSLAA